MSKIERAEQDLEEGLHQFSIPLTSCQKVRGGPRQKEGAELAECLNFSVVKRYFNSGKIQHAFHKGLCVSTATGVLVSRGTATCLHEGGLEKLAQG